MLSVSQLLKLDPSLERMEPKELEELHRMLYDTAQLAFEEWHRGRCSKNPLGSLQIEEGSPTLKA